jgi:hypothetical protein
MRIVSHLVPSGQPISTDIEGARKPGENVWEIPSWGRPLALGVYPFFLSREQRLVPIGTAFCISKLGVSLTASHNLRETIRHLRPDGMAVFHHRAPGRGRFFGKIWSFEGIQEVHPTDICYVFPQFQSEFPYLPLPISFTAPRIGSRVVCVGFGCLSVPDGSLSLDDVRNGRLNLLDIYEHELRAVEAPVTRIFRQCFEPGFIGGPCCTIDAEIEHNMNGGPVFSENGYVCGFISWKATRFFDEPTTIVSLLHPALSANVQFGGQFGKFRIRANPRLIDLIKQGSVITDDSERLLTASQSSESSFSAAIPGEDDSGVYKDFSDFLRKGRQVKGRKSL